MRSSGKCTTLLFITIRMIVLIYAGDSQSTEAFHAYLKGITDIAPHMLLPLANARSSLHFGIPMSAKAAVVEERRGGGRGEGEGGGRFVASCTRKS